MVSEKEMYSAMRIKTHLNNAPYQITAVFFEHELVIGESPAGSYFNSPFDLRTSGPGTTHQDHKDLAARLSYLPI